MIRRLVYLLRASLSQVVFTFLVATARWWRPRHVPAERSAIIVTPGAAGSLGDEAMVQALKGLLVECGFRRLTILSLIDEVPAHYLNHVPADVAVRGVVLGSASRRLWDFVRLSRTHSHCFIVGADVMDGYYSMGVSRVRFQLASLAARLNLSSTITGFSLRSDLPEVCAGMLRRAAPRVRLCLRDAVSLERHETRSGHSGELVADLAFLLRPEDGGAALGQARAWCQAERARGQIVLGINANFLTLDQIAPDPEACARTYAALVTELAERLPELSFLLLPHDLRTCKHKISDVGLCHSILAGIPEAQRSRCYIGPCETAAEVKALVVEAELVFTGRMHLAIAALGRGVPAAGLVYQGKFEGLYRHFGLAGLQIAPSQLTETSAVATWLLGLVETRQTLRAQVMERLPAVLALARRNVAEASLS